jgi:hypothetical protein
MIRPNKRNARLGLLLLVLLGSAALAFGSKKASPSRVTRGETATAQAVEAVVPYADALDLSALKPRAGKKEVRDVFVEFRVEPPPAPPVVRKEPPPPLIEPVVAPPQAPALPLRYLGRMTNDGVLKVFVAKGESSYTLAVADVIDNTYRLEEIADDALEFTYLPLNIRQTLNLRFDH